MACTKCGKKNEKEWNFCPYCGNGLKEEFEIDLKGLNEKVKMMLTQMGLPDVNVEIKQSNKSATALEEKEEKHEVEETVEPFLKRSEAEGVVKYVLKLPGVESAKEISIKLFAESIEIKAYAKKRCYFKIISIRPGAQVVEKKFQHEMLKLVVK